VLDYGYVQAALLLQMVLWLKLYHAQIDLGKTVETLFYLGGIAALTAIQFYQPHMGFFTPWLLTQYTIYVMASVTVFKTRFNFRKSLCLGFLVVFLNSFYWEFFYHVYEFQLWWPASLSLSWWYLRIPQWIRLIPAWFLHRNFRLDTVPIVLGLVASYALTYARFVLNWSYIVLHPIHRLLCLGMLLYVVLKGEERE